MASSFSRCLIAAPVVLLSLLSCSAAYAATQYPLHVTSFAAPGNAVQLEYAPEHHTLFMRNSGSAIRIIDTETQSQRELFLAINSFSDMSLTPDGRYLFVADYGGERMGYGTPLSPHWVHRYDLVSQTWESQLAPLIAWKIEAVSADRVLLQEHDQHVDMTLNSFTTNGMAELSRISADYYGDFEYDPKYQRVYHGSSGSSSEEIHVRRLLGDVLINAGNTGTYGTADDYGPTSVLSTDGERFYYGRLQVEALDVTNNLHVFPSRIYAATPQYAFSSNGGYYDPASGQPLGSLGVGTSVYGLSADGTELWAFEPDGDILHHFVLIPEPASLMFTALAAAICLGRRAAARHVGIVSP